jgi:hypothetical protein
MKLFCLDPFYGVWDVCQRPAWIDLGNNDSTMFNFHQINSGNSHQRWIHERVRGVTKVFHNFGKIHLLSFGEQNAYYQQGNGQLMHRNSTSSFSHCRALVLDTSEVQVVLQAQIRENEVTHPAVSAPVFEAFGDFSEFIPFHEGPGEGPEGPDTDQGDADMEIDEPYAPEMLAEVPRQSPPKSPAEHVAAVEASHHRMDLSGLIGSSSGRKPEVCFWSLMQVVRLLCYSLG